MTTCTTVVTAATKTARAKSSRKKKLLESEEKNEDNETSDDTEARPVEGDRLEAGGAEAPEPCLTPRATDVEVAEQPDEADSGEPTNAELAVFTKMIEKLGKAVSRCDTEAPGQVPSGMKELARSLQRLTTTVMNRAPEALEGTVEQPSDHGRSMERVVQVENRAETEDEVQAARDVGRNSQQGEEQRNSDQHEAHQRVREHRRSAPRWQGRVGRRSRSREREREWRPEGRHDRRQRGSRSPPRRRGLGGQPADDDGSSGDDSSDNGGGRPYDSDGGSSDDNSDSGSSYEGGSDSSDRSVDNRRHRRPRQRDQRRESRGRSRQRERRNQRERRERPDRRDRRGRREQRQREERHTRHRHRPRNIKDLELPSFTPTPRASVSTWVDRIDLALKGARESGRGEWSDRSLYFILGNKLMESAARWWVNMDRRLTRRERTWTNLKVALLRRYGPRVDKSTAEARVNSRLRFRDEPYADFAAGLREAADRNEVSERVFLAQFYRCLDRTVRQLVKQPPTPLTLEEAVEKAIEIDDPMDYGVPVVMGMNPLAVSESTSATTATDEARMVVIPGVGTLKIPEKPNDATEGSAVLKQMSDAMAVCNNQQGIYNGPAGVYEFPPGKSWNGRYWAVKPKVEKKKSKPKLKPDVPKTKAKKPVKRTIPDSSTEEEKEAPRIKRPKTTTTTAAVKRATANNRHYGTTRFVEARQTTSERRERAPPGPCCHCGQNSHWSAQCPVEPRCYACQKRGHFARDCPNEDAKKRNDEYLQKRAEEKQQSSGNEKRA